MELEKGLWGWRKGCRAGEKGVELTWRKGCGAEMEKLKIRQTGSGTENKTDKQRQRRQTLRRLTNLLLYRHFMFKLFSLKRSLDHLFCGVAHSSSR